MRVLITGGHITPALAVIDELQSRKQDICFVGRRFANEREKLDTFEYKEIASRGISFYDMPSGRLQKSFTLDYIKQIWFFCLALVKSFRLIQKINPEVIISFGGYIAFPVCIAAAIMRKRVVAHEQTIEPGSTNRIIALFAQSMCYSFPESKKYFVNKGVLTGNPIRKSLLRVMGDPVISHIDSPLIFVSGGSLGSHSINLIVEHNLEKLKGKFTIIHQTGNIQEFGDFERLSKLQNARYHVFDHLSTQQMAWIFHNTALIISRAGANTVSEIIAFQKPAILIPLPWSARGEQLKHAQLLKDHHVAEIFTENTPDDQFFGLVERVLRDKDTYIKNFHSLQSYYYADAAEHIVNIALSLT